MKMIVIAAAVLLASTAAGESAPWPVEPMCEGGKLVGIRVPVPSGAPPGLFITVRLTDEVCKDAPPQQPPPSLPPKRQPSASSISI